MVAPKLTQNIKTKNASNKALQALQNMKNIKKQLNSRSEGKTKKRKELMVWEEIEKKKNKRSCDAPSSSQIDSNVSLK